MKKTRTLPIFLKVHTAPVKYTIQSRAFRQVQQASSVRVGRRFSDVTNFLFVHTGGRSGPKSFLGQVLLNEER